MQPVRRSHLFRIVFFRRIVLVMSKDCVEDATRETESASHPAQVVKIFVNFSILDTHTSSSISLWFASKGYLSIFPSNTEWCSTLGWLLTSGLFFIRFARHASKFSCKR